ncbi:MAG: tetratricopeptide repeat protein, partial [Zoogloea sp.]|uniref:tetratricopeptide repeat protein n=1 Tax=Zoogloea sp. TaxID=49181 RepID=UPI003F2C0565
VRSVAVTQGKIADILQVQEQLDEAQRIHTELQLPVYEKLGDVRSVAMTQGKIADILLARGQLDEALELHAKRLPVAQSMQDLDSLAHIRFSMAVVRWMRGDLEQDKEAIRTIFLEMEEAYRLVTQLGRVEAVGSIGIFWAQILDLADKCQAAHQVLNEAEAAFSLLKHAQGLATIQALRQRIPTA